MRYTIGIIVIIVIAVLATVFFVGRGNRSEKGIAAPQAVHTADFIEKANSSVAWTQEGRLVGSDQRRAVRIVVSPTVRRAEIVEGYNGKVLKSMDLPNDKVAFSNFMLALENLNYGQERKVKNPDDRGACPLGHRFIYEIKEGDTQKLRLWSTSCNSKDGTFNGVATTTRQVFKNQITGYDKFISGVKF